jgi:hypothetical protein
MPPLKLYIEVKDDGKKSKLSGMSLTRRKKSQSSTRAFDDSKAEWKVFVSDKFIEPNEVNSMYTFTNQTKMTIDPKGAGIFKKREQQNEFNSSTMYFNIVS